MTTEERLRVLREAKPNTWIAFSADESKVVAAAENYSDAVKTALENGEKEPVILRTPENWLPRMFLHWV
jgi:hypothetical protein